MPDLLLGFSRFSRPIDRGRYAALGIGLALLKYNLDLILVSITTGKSWRPLFYWTPNEVLGILTGAGVFAPVRGWLLVVALPFVFAGTLLTLRRLRSVGWSPFLVLAFFVPVLNVCLFIVLCAIPPRPAPGRDGSGGSRFFDRIVPESQTGAAAVAVFLAVVTTLFLAFVATALFGDYGTGVFVGLPFFMGMASSTVYGHHAERTLRECLFVALLSVGIASLVAFGLAVEGFLCIAMAFPIAVILAFLGAYIGYLCQRGRRRRPDPALASLLIPIAMFSSESFAPAQPTLLEVRTTVEVAAPPQQVWRHVVAFDEIPAPQDWLFRAGIAYPLRAEIDGHGPGAVRRCVFSTGAFVEPIEIWDEPRLLKFSVAAQPAAMREWSPWPGLSPPHVDDYLVSLGGQFRLEATPSGGTLLEGTTWYTHALRPEEYWRLWSDAIIHRIHRRVLDHIKERAESEAVGPLTSRRRQERRGERRCPRPC